MNTISQKIESLVYLVYQPKTVFCFHGKEDFKAVHEKLIENMGLQIKTIRDEIFELLKQTKTDHATLVEKTQKEIEENVSDSMMYKLQHGKEHLSKANYNQKYRDQKQAEIRSLAAHLQSFYRIVQLSVISSTNKVILSNELRFSNVRLFL